MAAMAGALGLSKMRVHSDRDVAGFVLAGGQSSRMGRDKALLPFAGRLLIERAISTLRDAGLKASIAGPRGPLSEFAPVVLDSRPGEGPLAGICAALAATSARYAFFLPIDLPLLPAPLVAYLVHHATATTQTVTIPSIGGVAQTFPAVLDRGTLLALKSELEAGRRGCLLGFQKAAGAFRQSVTPTPVELLVQAGQIGDPWHLPPMSWFLNVNTPEELQHAESFLTSR
jgi:molybdenum cofactor guanylyltransferase